MAEVVFGDKAQQPRQQPNSPAAGLQQAASSTVEIEGFSSFEASNKSLVAENKHLKLLVDFCIGHQLDWAKQEAYLIQTNNEVSGRKRLPPTDALQRLEIDPKPPQKR